MSDTISYFSDLPDSPYYVVGHDTFMSNWINGPTENKDNWIILLCENKEEAEIVHQSCNDRTDIVDAMIVKHKGENYRKMLSLFSRENVISLMDREDCYTWYEKDAFAHLR